jgi:hypothetical protein
VAKSMPSLSATNVYLGDTTENVDGMATTAKFVVLSFLGVPSTLTAGTGLALGRMFVKSVSRNISNNNIRPLLYGIHVFHIQTITPHLFLLSFERIRALYG